MTPTTLLEQLAQVPESPGVYLWKDAAGSVLYVGKAKMLRRRMRQYVTGHDERDKIPLMMSKVASFDYVVTVNEVESLILEVNLINQFHPPFNVDYRDDKSFPFIAITTDDVYPGIKYTREKRRAGTTYFGPYTDARAARETIEALRRIVPICRCTCPEWKRLKATGGKPTPRPCFDSHIGLGPGACTGAITPAEYEINVARVMEFLSGKHDELEQELAAQMNAAARELDFEGAARYRNRLQAVQAIRAKQTMVADTSLNLDIVGFHREETIAGVYVLTVREGRVLYGNEYILDKGFDIPADELTSQFITRYYSEVPSAPRELVIAEELEDREAIEQWLGRLRSEQGERATRSKLTVAQRGIKHDLLKMAERNAQHALLRFMVRTRYSDERLNSALLQLESALSLPAPPLRIECYDISTLHGAHSVGSMVVFTDGQPDKAAYRRFKVRLDSGEANDVAMMREVLTRRFSKVNRNDARFAASLPNLLLVDGGKPQVSAAVAALEEMGIRVPVVGLAKRDEEIWTTTDELPVVLPDGSASLYLVKRIRDEAHRFAIEYHRLLRGKAMTTSVLDEVVGVGPKRKKAILRHFGSLKKLREATVDEIAAAPGVTADVAGAIHAVLHGGGTGSRAELTEGLDGVGAEQLSEGVTAELA